MSFSCMVFSLGAQEVLTEPMKYWWFLFRATPPGRKVYRKNGREITMLSAMRFACEDTLSTNDVIHPPGFDDAV